MSYKGIYEITMVEADKMGPYATTLLRICMNSSVRQPLPAGVSFNDCLLKSPMAFADLFTVLLGMREHRVAFNKEISKFYQNIQADETAQHMKRILRSFGA